MLNKKILLIESDRLFRDFVSDLLSKKKFQAVVVDSDKEAIEVLRQTSFHVIIANREHLSDYAATIRQCHQLNPSAFLVVTSTTPNKEQPDVHYYLLKPFCAEQLEDLLQKAEEHHSIQNKLKEGAQLSSKIIAESPAMKRLMLDVKQIAKSQASVFISGESGTGKEVIAQAIHFLSERAQKPFIRVNCAAMSETLIESEFFGHEKGAFTGASNRRIGRFELAHEGTFLLDEVTEIPPSLQAKLLRAVQELEFERVGGTKAIKVDVRFISTSNRNLQEAIADRILREDLYYRLNVVPIQLLPLRERKEDILPLANYFLEKACISNKKPLKLFSEEAKNALVEYSWPGNIRELANIIERAVVLDDSLTLRKMLGISTE